MLRPVDIGSKEHNLENDPGPRPTLEWVEIASLRIDDTYQRPLKRDNWRAIGNIAASFSWARFQPLVLAQLNDGLFAIIDGQHRAHAAKICGHSHVPAMIVSIDRREQASAFSWINGQTTNITAFHVFKAALASGEKWALDCDTVVQSASCRLMTSNRSAIHKKPGEIYSLQLIKSYVTDLQSNVVATGLAAIRRSDEGSEVDLYAGPILKPWFAALATSVRFLRMDLVAFINQHSLLDMEQAASARARTPEMRSQRKTRYAIMRDELVEHLRKADIGRAA